MKFKRAFAPAIPFKSLPKSAISIFRDSTADFAIITIEVAKYILNACSDLDSVIMYDGIRFNVLRYCWCQLNISNYESTNCSNKSIAHQKCN